MPGSPGPEVGVCLLDAGGIVVDFDPEFAQLLKLDDQARGRPLAQVLASAPELLSNHRTSARLDGDGGEVELRCRPSSGSAVAHVLTARRARAESALESQLRVARQTLDSIVNASPLAMLILDRNKRVVMWNPAAERIFGWTAAELLGQPVPIVPEAQREDFERLFAQIVVRGQGFTGIEATRQRKDGSLVQINLHTAPLRDADGELIGGLVLLEDLTEKHQLEARSREGQKMEAIGRLAGGIAHDFNNLLTVVLGNADLMLLDPQLSSAVRERIEEILRVGRSGRELVAQLMTFSRREVTHPKQVDVNERIVDAARLLERLLGETVELRIELGPERARVRIDPTQLDQILVNLAVNARDAMPRGGTVRVRTGVVEHDRGLLADGRYVCIEVSDDGVGIAPEVLPHIFEPFFTTKPDHPHDGGGTGLGLANVYAIVRHAGGDVVVESELEVGSRFRVYLPLLTAPSVRVSAAAAKQSGPHPVAVPRGTERILLVEDNDAVRNSTAKLLAALGYQVETAREGGEVLARWDELGVDLVLTDLAMPGIGGAELAEQLYERAPDLPIVFMSGNLDVEQLRTQVEQGRARFLQKPVSLRELAQVTREMLDAAALASSRASLEP